MPANSLCQLHATSSNYCDHFNRFPRNIFVCSKQLQPGHVCPNLLTSISKPLEKVSSSMRSTRSSSRRVAASASAVAAAAAGKEGDPAARQHHPLLDTINESTKWMVSAAVFTTLALRRDLVCAWWVLGSILAAILCKALKFTLNEARPPTARKADPGMPSSHANSLGFLAMFVSVWAAHSNTSPVVFLLSIGIPALGIFLTWLRVALGYHTVEQVTAGWLLGSSIAICWWYLGIKKALPVLVERPELQLALYSVTTVAITFFILSNVGRWVKELGNIKKSN
jgi:dolichyldiphosphatase